jgi:lipopolysaccharide biosynthesis glycosyltransferase
MNHDTTVKDPLLNSSGQTPKGDDKKLDSQTVARPLILICDESYAMPLATALRSIVEANRSNEPLDVYVLSDHFSANLRQEVIDSLPQGSASIHWMAVDLSLFEKFETLPHISKITYARLLIPHMFPESVSRVLYLDADILVLDDLGPLWDTDLKGAVVGAVLDPTMDARIKGRATGNDDVPEVQDYFNAGVLLIDLDRWREERISEKALEYLNHHPRSFFADQDALNLACDGRWTALDLRWNFFHHWYTSIRDMTPAERPMIAHFVTSRKPWIPASLSVNAGLYDAVRSRTRFARTGVDKAQDLARSVWPRFKRVLKRAPFVHAIWTGFKHRNQT